MTILLVTISCLLLYSQAQDPNLCPEMGGCSCKRLNKEYPHHEPQIAIWCSETIDPPLHLMPHNFTTKIILRKSIFHNISVFHEIRKTRVVDLDFFYNVIGDGKGVYFDWEWVPDTTGNLTIWNNGFLGFTVGGLRFSNCEIERFPEPFTLYIRNEKFFSPPSCMPENTKRLILSDLSHIKMDLTAPNFTWPSKLSIIKITEGGFGKIPKRLFANAPSSLANIWINLVKLEDGIWPERLPVDYLKSLYILNSGLTTVPPDEMASFRKANKLRQLSLSHNSLTEVPPNMPASLTYLKLDDNNIRHVEPKTWESVPQLAILDLSNNHLARVPLGMPSTLQRLHLHDNNIDYSDPSAFTEMKNLIALDLSNNRLTTLPKGIQPGIFMYLLQSNEISLVQDPSGYNFCTKCQTMWIFDNPWLCDFQMMQMLAWLSVRNASVASYGEHKDNNPHCQKVPLKGTDNWFEVVQEYMEYFKKAPNDMCFYDIESLKCEDAGLSDVPAQIPPGLTKISITDNLNLTTIPDFKFANQRELRKLFLDNNSLIHLPFGLPQYITVFSLRDNQIGDFSEKDVMALKNLTNLKSLYLENNRITTLHAWQFENLPQLKWIGLTGNTLHCGCDLLSFIIWIEEAIPYRAGSILASYPQCYTPIEQRYQYLSTQIGNLLYGVSCLPIECGWNMNLNAANCSAAFQEQYQFTKTHLETAPKIPNSSFWKLLDLSGLKLRNDQIKYKHLTQLKKANISDNALVSVPYEGLPTSVEELDLTDNQITHIPMLEILEEHLPNLRKLDVRRNKIQSLNTPEISAFQFIGSVLLEGNPFVCNCSLRALATWIHINRDKLSMLQSYDLMNIQCQHTVNAKHVRIADMTEQEFCPELPIAAIIGSCVAGLGFGTILLIIVNVYLQKKRKNQVKDEILRGFQGLLARETETDITDPETGIGPITEYKFDAFVSYDADGPDAEFVITLLEEMEDKRGYKLCLNERDFMPGAGIADNIVECIGTSKRIILILSKNFVSSPWCQYEVQVALAQLHQRRRSKFLVSLLLEDISCDENLAESVRTFLSLVPGIMVPMYGMQNPKDALWKEFWGKLTDAMPFQNQEYDMTKPSSPLLV